MRTDKKKTTNKRPKTKPKPTQEELIQIEKRKATYRFIGGLTLLIANVLLIAAFISFLFTGKHDQHVLDSHGPWSEASNWLGYMGAWMAQWFANNMFGLATIFVFMFFIALSLRLMKWGHIRLWKWFINCTLLTVWCSVSLQFALAWLSHTLHILNHFPLGGQHGKYMVETMENAVGWIGTAAILILVAVIYFVYLSSETIDIIKKTCTFAWLRKKKVDGEAEDTNDETMTEEAGCEAANDEEPPYAIDDETSEGGTIGEDTQEPASDNTIEFEVSGGEEEQQPEAKQTDEKPQEEEKEVDFGINKPIEEEVASEKSAGALEPYDPKLDLERYKYPVLELLNKPAVSNAGIDYDEQNQNKDRIIRILKNFGVEISSIRATVGPTITLYEIQPAPGVKISKIRNLEDDIALSLSALGIRIIAPIPGKGTIGIEVPNKKPQMVPMESILNSQRFLESDYELPMALGKTITNEVFMVDLAKMPHLLVAGATGQGKSVGLNAIITSLLYKKHPAELKLVMVDPKKVEFSVYSPLVHHFLAQVEDEDEDDAIITDVKKVVATLNSLCAEMDERYDLLKRCRVRNIKEYNAKFKARQLNPENGHRFLPYIVVIIDEFGDLIMTAGKEVELPIARIAQLARAVGIHMIIATQRPTTNIITGTIKANFPARMAFKVSQMIDSRTILDRPGANQLVGKGDMLFLSGAEPVRVQCAFVDTPEVERIANFIACQQGYPTSFQLKRVVTEGDEEGGAADVDMKHLDPMFDEIAHWVVAAQQGSTSAIQRKFSIGYNRAGRITDQLEAAGIVGPAQGSKPREVLCISDEDLEYKLNNLR